MPVLKSAQFDDVYFSVDGGRAESEYVFLQHNKLPERFSQKRHFTIGETGFGTGLNCFVAAQAFDKFCHTTNWQGRLHILSVEKYPLSAADIKTALVNWPDLMPIVNTFLQHYPLPGLGDGKGGGESLYPGFHLMPLTDRVDLILMVGDILPCLQAANAQVDAWFLDGFAPSKNPDMWSPAVCEQLTRLSSPDATFSTFTAAGAVRQNLTQAGFAVKKTTGYGRKRHMCHGQLTSPHQPKPAKRPWFHRPPPISGQHTAVIGAGLAGCAIAQRLAHIGQAVTLIDAHPALGGGASGNPIGVIKPFLTVDHSYSDAFYTQGCLLTMRLVQQLQARHVGSFEGIFQVLQNDRLVRRYHGIQKRRALSPDWLTLTNTTLGDRDQEIAQTAVGGVMDPIAWMQALLSPYHMPVGGSMALPGMIRTCFGLPVAQVLQEGSSWHIAMEDGEQISADQVVFCLGVGGDHFIWTQGLPITPSIGQISVIPAITSYPYKQVLSYEGYLTPPLNGVQVLGASFREDRTDYTESASEHTQHLAQLHAVWPSFEMPNEMQGRVSARAVTEDHLPFVGALHNQQTFEQHFATAFHGAVGVSPLAPLPGAYVSMGHGARGLSSTVLSAAHIAALMTGAPLPIPQRVSEMIHPARRWCGE